MGSNIFELGKLEKKSNIFMVKYKFGVDLSAS